MPSTLVWSNGGFWDSVLYLFVCTQTQTDTHTHKHRLTFLVLGGDTSTNANNQWPQTHYNMAADG